MLPHEVEIDCKLLPMFYCFSLSIMCTEGKSMETSNFLTTPKLYIIKQGEDVKMVSSYNRWSKGYRVALPTHN